MTTFATTRQPDREPKLVGSQATASRAGRSGDRLTRRWAGVLNLTDDREVAA